MSRAWRTSPGDEVEPVWIQMGEGGGDVLLEDDRDSGRKVKALTQVLEVKEEELVLG